MTNELAQPSPPRRLRRRPDVVGSGGGPRRLRPARAVLRATAVRSAWPQKAKDWPGIVRPMNWTAGATTSITGRLNYLPRSHAHVDSRCILMLHRRTAGSRVAVGQRAPVCYWVSRQAPSSAPSLVGNQSLQYSFLPRRVRRLAFPALLNFIVHRTCNHAAFMIDRNTASENG